MKHEDNKHMIAMIYLCLSVFLKPSQVANFHSKINFIPVKKKKVVPLLLY